MKKGKGWHGQSVRHSMARRGIKTAQKIPNLHYKPYSFDEENNFMMFYLTKEEYNFYRLRKNRFGIDNFYKKLAVKRFLDNQIEVTDDFEVNFIKPIKQKIIKS